MKTVFSGSKIPARLELSKVISGRNDFLWGHDVICVQSGDGFDLAYVGELHTPMPYDYKEFARILVEAYNDKVDKIEAGRY